jgi:Kef-type K+ transport system membrane component KefB
MLPRYSIASLFALGLMMALFHRVTAAGPLEARATLALGFLLLAALLGGDLAQRAHLPRLTGYVLVGLAVGPAWLGLVRRDEVEALRFIEDAAVALIALAAGSEIKLAALREGRVALARVAGGAIVFPFLAITLVVLSVGRWFPLTVHQPVGDVVAVAAALGTLAAASSPAVVVAMINELDARGPLARTLLTVTVMKDVAVALLFTLVLMLLRVLTSAGALNLAVAAGALLGLTVAVAVGGLLGFALGRYLKLGDTALLLVATAFMTAALGRLAHLDSILVALAAGFYLENFSTVESERLRHELQRGSLPVVVAFFAVTGAGLRVGVLQELWPWVLLLVGLRAVSLRVGLRWAGRDARVAPALAREGWLGLLSQSGLALGLARVARRAFPEWGVSLEALVIAMIGVHEIVGPICFRLALARAGELTGGRADVERPGDLAGGTVVAARGGL